MNSQVVTICLLLTLGHSSAFQCKIEEKCIDGILITSSTASDYKNCLTLCKELSNCGFITFLEEIQTSNCELFEICQETEACDSCISGEVECPNFSCDLKGLCMVCFKF